MADFVGKTYKPGDDGYDEVRRPWKLTVDQHPALVVLAESVNDIEKAVDVVQATGKPFAIQATGHGAVRGCDDGILLNVSKLNRVAIDPEQQTARVCAGARWRDVLRAADLHGLAGLSGTAPLLGAVGYTLGGGVGLLHRRFGFAADSVLSATVLLADGTTVRANDAENTELFWALKGGGGNFGIVTELEFRLYPVREVYNGMLVYPGERAAEILRAWAEWTRDVSDDVTSGAMVVRLPPLPHLPEALRGRQITALRGTVAGGDPEPIARLRSSLGALGALGAPETLGEPLLDTFTTGSYLQAALSGMEPEEPSRVVSHGGLLATLDEHTIDRLVQLTSDDSPLMGIEIRHAGGAAALEPRSPSAVSHREAPYIVGLQAMIPTPDLAASVKAFIATAYESLKSDLYPGNHLNFLPSDTTDEDVRAAFTAAKYALLQRIKAMYDPGNVFRFGQNIPPES